jgi:ribosomal protein S18 acetylase RimI-like enzyme
MSAVDELSAGFVEFASRIQSSIRAQSCRWRDCERIGPFVATFNNDDDNPFLNYAIPEDGAVPTPAEVEALVGTYRKRRRRPRLEYIPALAPAVEPVLVDLGFAVEGRLPLMTCAAASDVREVIVGRVQLVAPGSEDGYRAAASVQWEAYEEQGDLPQRAVDSLRRTVEADGIVVLARDVTTGEPAGAGACTAPHEGLTELTSVAVREGFRRRGIAAAMASWLAEQAFAKGMRGVFLMAHSEREARIYARAGFACRSEVLHISRA